MSDALRSKPIAIKFGSSTTANGKPSSSSRSKPQPSQLGKRPRPSAWGDEDGSGSDSDGPRGHHEKITGFGAEGAETSSKRRRDGSVDGKRAYVIERQPNRDWKSQARAAAAATQNGRRSLLPPEARAAQNGNAVETEPADQDRGIRWGLTVRDRRVPAGEDAEASTHRDDTSAAQESDSHTELNGPSSAEQRGTSSIEEQAMLRLMGQEAPREIRTIPSESDALQRDLATAGEASTLADYEAMPVEEFGAALLRGMGWNGEESGPKVKEVKRRPNRLGLGAKELKGDEELGGWNQGKKDNRRPRLSEYRREEEKRREKRREGREDSYKRERESEREYERNRRYHDGNGHSSRKDRNGDYDRERRR